MIPEFVECAADTHKRLSNKPSAELINYLIGVARSIRSGHTNSIYYQEWSVGIDLLRRRGFVITCVDDLKDITKGLNISTNR